MKITMAFFHRNRKTILNFIWNQKRPQIAKAIWDWGANDTTMLKLSMEPGTGRKINTYTSGTELRAQK